MPTRKDVYLEEGIKMVEEINTLLKRKDLKKYNDLFSGESTVLNLLRGTLVSTYKYLINEIEQNLDSIIKTQDNRKKIASLNYYNGNNLNATGRKEEAAPFISTARIFRQSVMEINNLFGHYKTIRQEIDDNNGSIELQSAIFDLDNCYKILTSLEKIKKIEVPLPGDRLDQGDEFSDFLETTLYNTYYRLINEQVRYFIKKLQSDDEDLIMAKINFHQQASVLFENDRDEEAIVMLEKANYLETAVLIFQEVYNSYHRVQKLVD